jgi:hypothetical protein
VSRQTKRNLEWPRRTISDLSPSVTPGICACARDWQALACRGSVRGRPRARLPRLGARRAERQRVFRPYSDPTVPAQARAAAATSINAACSETGSRARRAAASVRRLPAKSSTPGPRDLARWCAMVSRLAACSRERSTPCLPGSRGTSPAAATALANDPKWFATVRALGQSPWW